MKVRVLVVEDERQLADSIAEGLRHHAMAVDVAYDGEAGLDRATINDYDVLVLDRDLPILSGDEVCAALVEEGSAARILMLTAATAVSQRVAGLGLGADDYLTKPFAFAELVARVQALGRRSRPVAAPVYWSAPASVSIRIGASPRVTGGRSICPERNSLCSKS
jgi:DNA-binding response OmpR family regulator